MKRRFYTTFAVVLTLLFSLLLSACSGWDSDPTKRYRKNRTNSTESGDTGEDPDMQSGGSSHNVTPGLTVRLQRHGYSTEKIIEYFKEIALGAEFGTSVAEIHKWTDPIVVFVAGTPTAEDINVLQSVFSALNSTHGFPGIRESRWEGEANLTIYFEAKAEYDQRKPSSLTGDTDGYASCWWADGTISSAQIGIRSDIRQQQRNSVIWEEIVQSMGLLNDSYIYPDSLFYQGYNEAQQPTTLDWLMLEILYHPSVRPGMNYDNCVAVIKTILE